MTPSVSTDNVRPVHRAVTQAGSSFAVRFAAARTFDASQPPCALRDIVRLAGGNASQLCSPNTCINLSSLPDGDLDNFYDDEHESKEEVAT